MPPDTIDLSLNEVETMALKAARGAGLPWGVAEDAGRSAAWLAAHLGVWAASLLDLLETPAAAAQAPLLLGGYLTDSAPQSTELARVVAPVWLLPPLLVGPGRRIPVYLRIGRAKLGCVPGGMLGATLPAEALLRLPAGTVTLRFTPPPALPHAIRPRFTRSTVARPLLDRLSALAARTYVAASDWSRRTGAGGERLDEE